MKESIKNYIHQYIKRISLYTEKISLYEEIINLDYSRIEFAADARHRVCGCGSPLQMPCNEVDAVKSSRPKSKLGRHIIKRNSFETD